MKLSILVAPKNSIKSMVPNEALLGIVGNLQYHTLLLKDKHAYRYLFTVTKNLGTIPK